LIPGTQPRLRRALGRWDLTAIGVNQVIGGAIFLMPSQVAAQLGNWSPIVFLCVGLASLFVALCFAEVGSRFEGTGGPYLYTRAAFGDFVAFEVGWMQWFTRVASQSSVANGLALALAFYWPAMRLGWARGLLITGLTLALGVINARGIQQTKWVVNALTVSKLVPMAIFIAAGVFFADWHRLVPLPHLTASQVGAGGLLLIFIYGGFDVISVPAGEAKDPRRDVASAFILTIAIVTTVLTLAQIVTMTTLANVAKSATPVADSALAFLGPAGAAMIGIGSVISMTGNCTGQVLTGSRMLFALAENRALPKFFGRIHPDYRTPSNAVWFTTIVALVLALSGSFAVLAIVSAVARLVAYTGVAASTLTLRRPRYRDQVKPATFVIPFGPVIPALAILVSLAILAGASRQQLLGGAAALVAGAVLFLVNRLR
jgi:amino acid transporter